MIYEEYPANNGVFFFEKFEHLKIITVIHNDIILTS